MFKKILSIALALALVIGTAPAFAQSRHSIRASRTIETTGILTDQDGVTMDYSVWVYGVSIYADAASSYVGLYDCDTTAELNSASEYPKYEVGEPTQYEVTTEWFDEPLYFGDGVGAIIFTGVAIVYYGPEPTN